MDQGVNGGGHRNEPEETDQMGSIGGRDKERGYGAAQSEKVRPHGGEERGLREDNPVQNGGDLFYDTN